MNSPLSQLHPLLYPESPGHSSLLWLVVILFILLSGSLLFLLARARNSRTFSRVQNTDTVDPVRQQALQELQELPRPRVNEPAGVWLQQINKLLKRLCSVHYPEHSSHRLSGREWLAFLDSRCPAAGLSHWMILGDGSYQPECRMEQQAMDSLFAAVQTWILKHA